MTVIVSGRDVEDGTGEAPWAIIGIVSQEKTSIIIRLLYCVSFPLGMPIALAILADVAPEWRSYPPRVVVRLESLSNC